MYLRLTATNLGTLNVNLALRQQEFFQLKELERVYLICDSRLNPINIQLPTIVNLRQKINLTFVVDDAFGSAATNNITITRGGTDKIDFNETTYVVKTNYHKVQVEQTLNNQDVTAGNWMVLPAVRIDMTVPDIFAISGVPVKGAGTIALSLVNQLANKIFAGPASGGAAPPTFRTLVAADFAGLGIPTILQGSATLNFPITAAQTHSDLTILVTGAVISDPVTVGVFTDAITPNSCYTAFVSAADTVTVRFNNYSIDAQNPASAGFKVTIIK